MIAKVHSAQVVGLKVDLIDIEVDISRGLHSFTIVGLPDKAVEEARDRISAAIKNSGLSAPQKSNNKIIVSLAPADLKKEGPVFDLGIALALLLARREVRFNPRGRAFLGELTLSGDLRPIRGVLMIARALRRAGFQELFLPSGNTREAALVEGLRVYGANNLEEIIRHFTPPTRGENGDDKEKAAPAFKLTVTPQTAVVVGENLDLMDLADIRGQATAKRGLEIAAAGGHNLAMYGPPGTGKTMLARALPGLLPPLNFEEMLEATGIHSAAGLLAGELVTMPPFRSPHHTASYISLVGGGAWPKPGEITLAHRGVLFLDEFAEFDKKVIEALRQPLEDRVIHIARARSSMMFPASFILVAAMNPCPCGYANSPRRACICSPSTLERYRRKISGPIIDRLDLWLEVPAVDHDKLAAGPAEEASRVVRGRIGTARALARERFAATKSPLNANSEMGVRDLERFAPLGAGERRLLTDSAKRLNLSARAYHRIIKIARTIADLANEANIREEHLLEALQYRPKK